MATARLRVKFRSLRGSYRIGNECSRDQRYRQDEYPLPRKGMHFWKPRDGWLETNTPPPSGSRFNESASVSREELGYTVAPRATVPDGHAKVEENKMKKLVRGVIVFSALAASLMLSAQTADEIVGKYLDAV